MALSSRFGKPNMTNIPRDVGESIFRTILSTPSPDREKMGVYANSEVLRYEPVYIENDYDAENALCIMVKGDSMYPKIEDGDIILVVKDIDYADGDIVAVMDDQDNGFVKKIYSFQDKLILRSINPEYQDMVFVREEMNAIKVVGVVKKVIKNV